MALTVAEANAVNRLLGWVLRTDGSSGHPPTDEQAREAADLLAAHAYKTLGAGLSGVSGLPAAEPGFSDDIRSPWINAVTAAGWDAYRLLLRDDPAHHRSRWLTRLFGELSEAEQYAWVAAASEIIRKGVKG